MAIISSYFSVNPDFWLAKKIIAYRVIELREKKFRIETWGLPYGIIIFVIYRGVVGIANRYRGTESRCSTFD